MDKKADSRLLYPFFIIAFAVIGGCLAFGIFILYSSSVDSRSGESKMMYNSIINGLVSNGYINENSLVENFDIFKASGLDKNIINNGDFYFSVVISQKGVILKRYSEGSKDFEVNCRLPGDNYPKCYEREISVLDKNKDKYQIKILTGSNQR